MTNDECRITKGGGGRIHGAGRLARTLFREKHGGDAFYPMSTEYSRGKATEREWSEQVSLSAKQRARAVSTSSSPEELEGHDYERVDAATRLQLRRGREGTEWAGWHEPYLIGESMLLDAGGPRKVRIKK